MLDFLSWLAFALSLSAVATFTCCCTNECQWCDSTVPDEIDVTLADLLAGTSGGPCTDCPSVNGVYRLARIASPPADDKCYWQYTFTSDVGGCDASGDPLGTLTLELGGGATPGRVTLTLASTPLGGFAAWRINWRDTLSTPIDCAFSGVVIPFLSSFGDIRCDGSSSTLTLDAV